MTTTKPPLAGAASIVRATTAVEAAALAIVDKDLETDEGVIPYAYSRGYLWGIRTYNFCQYGAGRGVKSTPSLAIRVGDAGKLEQRFAYTVDKGSSGDFNMLAETFLTSAPTGYSSGNLEVGFHLRNNWALSQWLKKKNAKTCKQPCEPAMPIARARGSFTDRHGQKWTVTDAPGPAGIHGYILIRPASPGLGLTSGTLPWGEALTFLVKTGIAQPDWYLQGVFFGPEVTSGRATVRVELGALSKLP